MTAGGMLPVLTVGEVGALGVEALRDLTGRAVGDAGLADYVEDDPMAWSVVADGGWDLLGAAESDGGGGAGLVDLVALARAWGRSCVPLPYVSSLLARRWSAAAREHPGPVGLALGGGRPGGGRVPFGRYPGLEVLGSEGRLVDPPSGLPDPWVPTLRPVDSARVSDLSDQQRRELAVVLAGEATGAADRVLELSVAYAREREQFGTAIGRFQAVKHRLSTMTVLSESAETAVLWGATEPSSAPHAASWATGACVTIAEHAIQVHGGMGFTWELGLHYYLRHLVTLRELVRGVVA